MLFLVLVLPGALAADGGAQVAPAEPEDDCPFIIFRCLPFGLSPPALKLECLCVP